MEGKWVVRGILVTVIMIAMSWGLLRQASCAVGSATYTDTQGQYRFDYPAAFKAGHIERGIPESNGVWAYGAVVTGDGSEPLHSIEVRRLR